MTTGTPEADFLVGDDDPNTISGLAGDDAIFGKGGADLLLGGDNNDLLVGGRGDDFLNGGKGNDTASYNDASLRVIADLATGIATLKIGNLIETDTLLDIENLSGGGANDDLSGNDGKNVLRGNGGLDQLYGRDGNDKLFGGADNDWLRGGAGADAMNGGSSTDIALYDESAEGVSVNLATGLGSGGEAEGDTLSGIENLYGSAKADTFTGDANANTLYGDAGADTLKGGEGDDELWGGAGADILNGGTGFDQVNFFGSPVGVEIDLAAGTANGGEAEGDIISGIEALNGTEHGDTLLGNGGGNAINGGGGDDELRGRGGADDLNGLSGADALYGGGGDDILRGGVDQDVLNGGTGKDTFHFFTTTETGFFSDTPDLIEDFVSGTDILDLAKIDANSLLVGDQKFKFIAGHFFNGIAGQLRVFEEGGNTFMEGDTDGDKSGDFQIEFTGAITFVDGDILL